jgi:hypothetical protein
MVFAFFFFFFWGSIISFLILVLLYLLLTSDIKIFQSIKEFACLCSTWGSLIAQILSYLPLYSANFLADSLCMIAIG